MSRRLGWTLAVEDAVWSVAVWSGLTYALRVTR